MKGKLIVIEGTDCSGKETQSKKLIENLEKNNKKVCYFCFPNYESPTGKIVGGPYLGKSYICDGWFKEKAPNVDSKVSSLYFAADRKYNINKIIDATHPYAIEVSKNAIQCAKELNIDYLRYERKSLIEDISYENKYIVSSIEEACKIAREKGRNIFIGTGSKNLPKIVELIPDRNLIVRVLPTSDVILSCESVGLNADNIIAMKGPFSQSINEEFYKHYNVDIVVTKESGIAGGFLEKVNACETLQIPVVIITREKINYPLVVNEIDELEKLL